jgi:hypothetical protein
MQAVNKNVASCEHICSSCGGIGTPRQEPQGNPIIEITLWLVGFLVCILPIPGIAYSIWRRNAFSVSCVHCGSNSVMPKHVPAAREIYAKFYGGHQ